MGHIPEKLSFIDKTMVFSEKVSFIDHRKNLTIIGTFPAKQVVVKYSD